MNVWYHLPCRGAGLADQEAALPAVVATVGGGELGQTTHALVGGAVRNPSHGVGGGGLAGAPLQQAVAVFQDVAHPGPLVLGGRGGHNEGLAGRTDQPLVGASFTVLQVLQLQVLC